MTSEEINTVLSVFAGRDLSFPKGTPLVQAAWIILFVAVHKPSALWVYLALLRLELHH